MLMVRTSLRLTAPSVIIINSKQKLKSEMIESELLNKHNYDIATSLHYVQATGLDA